MVSLLRFAEPRAYVSEKLPELERLKHVPTRELTEFERTSLPRLYCDEDLVISEQSDRVLMLGSLRAAQGCLQCHEVERGTLLGAFSYELRVQRVLGSSP